MLGLDVDGLRRYAHLTAADLGLLATDIGVPEPAELREARQALAELTEEVENAAQARDTAEALRTELEELEERLRGVQEGEAKRRYAQMLMQLEQVRAEAASLRGGSEAAATHKRLVAAAPDVRRLADRWQRAAARLATETERFGDRERLDPRALEDALAVPAEVPDRARRPRRRLREGRDRAGRPRGQAPELDHLPPARAVAPRRRAAGPAATRPWCGRRRTPPSTPVASWRTRRSPLGGLEADGGDGRRGRRARAGPRRGRGRRAAGREAA